MSLWKTQELKPGFSTSLSRLEATRLMMFFRRVSINNIFLKNSRQSYAIFPVQFKNNKLLIFQLRAENSTAPASTAAASFLLRNQKEMHSHTSHASNTARPSGSAPSEELHGRQGAGKGLQLSLQNAVCAQSKKPVSHLNSLCLKWALNRSQWWGQAAGSNPIRKEVSIVLFVAAEVNLSLAPEWETERKIESQKMAQLPWRNILGPPETTKLCWAWPVLSAKTPLYFL